MTAKSSDGVTTVEQGTYPVPDITIKELLDVIPSVLTRTIFFLNNLCYPEAVRIVLSAQR